MNDEDREFVRSNLAELDDIRSRIFVVMRRFESQRGMVAGMSARILSSARQVISVVDEDQLEQIAKDNSHDGNDR